MELPILSPGDLPVPRIKHACLASTGLAGGLFTTESPGKPIICIMVHYFFCFVTKIVLALAIGSYVLLT